MILSYALANLYRLPFVRMGSVKTFDISSLLVEAQILAAALPASISHSQVDLWPSCTLHGVFGRSCAG